MSASLSLSLSLSLHAGIQLVLVVILLAQCSASFQQKKDNALECADGGFTAVADQLAEHQKMESARQVVGRNASMRTTDCEDLISLVGCNDSQCFWCEYNGSGVNVYCDSSASVEKMNVSAAQCRATKVEHEQKWEDAKKVPSAWHSGTGREFYLLFRKVLIYVYSVQIKADDETAEQVLPTLVDLVLSEELLGDDLSTQKFPTQDSPERSGYPNTIGEYVRALKAWAADPPDDEFPQSWLTDLAAFVNGNKIQADADLPDATRIPQDLKDEGQLDELRSKQAFNDSYYEHYIKYKHKDLYDDDHKDSFDDDSVAEFTTSFEKL